MTRLQFSSLEEQKVPLRILFMGPFGCGKTYAIGYLSKRLGEITGKGVKLFDFDLGWQTLKTARFDLRVTSYLIDPNNQGRTFDEFGEDFFSFLDDPSDFSGFAIDSLTTLQSCAMDFVFKENKVNRRKVGKLELANENDYGALVTTMTQLMPQILQISSHSIFVMTAHTRFFEDKLSGEVKILPAISGRSLPSQIGGWFNECYFFRPEGFRGDVVRNVQTMSGSQVDCKTQIAGMPFELPIDAAIEKCLIAYGVNKDPDERTLDLLKPHFPSEV